MDLVGFLYGPILLPIQSRGFALFHFPAAVIGDGQIALSETEAARGGVRP